MSLSTLGAQLAALNGSSQGGSVLPTSRRHDDAVGRGLHHSVQVGHALTNKSHIYKPSILYETAREASNVPLTTLQENCMAALDELAMVDPYFGTVSSQITKNNERGLLTKQENEALDQSIQRLLFRLGVHMANAELVVSALNVVEYLIRAHDLHLRPTLVSTVLLVWLPQHENAYFLRWLQLVDLASVPTFSWLRPYAIPNAKVGRDVIAKAVSKNLALCRAVLQLAIKASSLPNADATMSFTAAVLVEAISLQHRAAGTMEERTGHALLPVIRRACQTASKNPLWANWGYVMASTVVEVSSLADGPRMELVASILHGLSTTNSIPEQDGDIVMDDAQAVADHDTIQNALIVVLSLLQQQPPMDAYHRDDEEEEGMILCQLPVGGDKKAMYGYQNAYVINSKIFWKALLKVEGLVSRLAQLLVEDGFLDVMHLVASLWVVGWKRAVKASSKSTSDEALEKLLLDLLQNEILFQHVWSHTEWIEALVSFTLSNTPIPEKQNATATSRPLLQTVLETLRQKNTSAYEQGVARALLGLKRKARSELAAFLGLAANSKAIGNPSEGDVALPPRVALDHADIEIRLDAIDRLVSYDEDKDISTVLLQRVLIEDDVDVATKATKAVCQLMDNRTNHNKTFDNKQVLGTKAFTDLVINGLYIWTEKPKSDSKSHLIRCFIRLTAMSASKVLEEQGINHLFVQLLEGIFAFLNHDDAITSNEAADGVITALTAKKGTKASAVEAQNKLTSHGAELLQYLCRSHEGVSIMEGVMRRRCIPSILKAYSVSLSKVKAADERLGPALDYCLWTLMMHGKSLSSRERALLLDVLKATTSQVVEKRKSLFSTLLIVLAFDGVLLEEVVSPFVVCACKNVKQKNGEKASAIAVMMELAVRPDTSSDVVEKLLAIANSIVAEEPSLCHFGLVYLLCLLCHADASVRKAAISLILAIGANLAKSMSSDIKSLAKVCDYVSENESSAAMGGLSFLSTCLRETASDSTGTGVVDLLLKLILCATGASASIKSLDSVSKLPTCGFLELADATGGHFASLVLLKAAQSAGETVFPLLSRWSNVAKPLLQYLLQEDTMGDLEDAMGDIPEAMQSLVEHLTALLKGMKTSKTLDQESSSVIIMTGPRAGGGRRRSYSFGKGEPSSFVSPYPKDMSATIVALLTSRNSSKALRFARNALSTHVLRSASWGENVFEKLSRSVRQQIVSTMLESIIDDFADSMESAFFSLPLSCSDVADLLKAKGGLAFNTYLADFTCANSKKLASGNKFVEVVVALLDIFMELSTGRGSDDDEDGINFSRMSILDALSEAFEACTGNATASGLGLNKLKKFDSWVQVLVGVISTKEGSSYRPLDSTRGRKSTLSVLTILCTLYPEVVIDKLIPVVASMASSAGTEKEASNISELLGSVVPVYLDLASKAGLTAVELMEAFISACGESPGSPTRIRLYQGFVDVISRYDKTGEGDLLGSFVSCCLAVDLMYAKQSNATPQSASLVQQMVSQVSVAKRVHVVLATVSYAKDAASLLGKEDMDESNKSVSLQCLLKLSGHKTTEKKGKAKSRVSEEETKALCHALVVASCEVISSAAFARYLRHSKTESSETIVRLWQDLLLIQSIGNARLGELDDGKNNFWSSMIDLVNETLDSIQTHLPSPIFLAFATSLVKESDSDDLRARALQFVSDRALQLDPANTESYLFMDMLPFLTSLVGKEDGLVIRQAALVAIEHITRKICFESLEAGTKYSDAVAKALIVSSELFESESKSLSLNHLTAPDSACVQLLCTASLCAATAVRACGARALPSLPKLLRPSFKVFGEVNAALAGVHEGADTDRSLQRILQLSSLRLISAVVETIPQFLSPYIEEMFRPSVLTSPSLYQTDDDQSGTVSSAAAKLRETMALKIPARQLLGPVTDAILNAGSAAGITTLVTILTLSIAHSKPSDIGGKTNSILNAATYVYDFACTAESSSDLVSLITEMLMTLVLKLSEVQLRSLYAKLRLWRGDLETENPTIGSFRRFCFWSFSASLATQLKSIYLPCLTSVFSDAADELETAVTWLTRRSKASGSKKQRLEGDESATYDTPSLRSLQAMLKCLEMSLRSDAHDGGSWIRDAESERFDLLVEPLGKLFNCKIRENNPELPSFRELVQGRRDDLGSVVECMVALALAAGDEQKWKPLNHLVLQACSNETRPEVRKAGVSCLLSLIKTIGEEYMVLIPECLPVLSELLEDTDEEIAGMTQECIQMSEELLGESLEDSLR